MKLESTTPRQTRLILLSFVSLWLIALLSLLLRTLQLSLNQSQPVYPFDPLKGQTVSLPQTGVLQEFRLPFDRLTGLRLAITTDQSVGQELMITLQLANQPPVRVELVDQQLLDNYFVDINLPRPIGKADQIMRLSITPLNNDLPSQHIKLKLLPQPARRNPLFAIVLLSPDRPNDQLMFQPHFAGQPEVIYTNHRISLRLIFGQWWRHLSQYQSIAPLSVIILSSLTLWLVLTGGLWYWSLAHSLQYWREWYLITAAIYLWL